MKTGTLITDAVVVNPTLPPRIYDPGWILIEKDCIRSVGEGAPPRKTVQMADRRIRARGSILMPGLVNCHNHAAMSLFRGLADDLPLMEWLQGTIFPAEARVVDEGFVFWGTLLSCAEMIRSGTTTFANGYFYENQALEAVICAGMRAILTMGVVDFPIPGCPDPSLNVEHAEGFVNRAGGEELVTPGIFCHSPYTCSPDTLSKAKEACRSLEAPLFIHVSETEWEVEEIRKRHGSTPVRHLDKLGILDEKTILVHGVWVDQVEIQIMADRGTGIAVCTESQMKLASGIAPVPDFLEKGLTVGLGTDGPASNNDLDLFQEMDLTAKLHKVHRGDPTILNANTVLNLATQGGARLLGLEKVGLLDPGYKADLILLKTDRPHLQPLYNPVSQLVYAATGGDVDTVWVNGRTIMENRRMLTVDEEEIYENVDRIKRKI
jgi:5-methylthioadenosine/S-adenosylhomocysteine deaminase